MWIAQTDTGELPRKHTHQYGAWNLGLLILQTLRSKWKKERSIYLFLSPYLKHTPHFSAAFGLNKLVLLVYTRLYNNSCQTLKQVCCVCACGLLYSKETSLSCMFILWHYFKSQDKQ